ncbi:MAG: class I SAM-dependent methyltransferase [Pseudomonadota bacterium]
MKKSEYDAFAKEYQESKQLPFRTYAEQPLLVELIGDVKGKAVLDLGCGEGIYARKIKELGAKTVVGVDLSSEMIALARTSETKNPLGIEYYVGDASTVGLLGQFDLVVGSYILNYARSFAHLEAFCRVIHQNLKPDGRFVGMNDNPANNPEHYTSYRKYGFVKSSPQPRSEGDTVTYTMFLPDGSSFSFDNFYLAPETYQKAFDSVGFTSMKWRPPKVMEAGLRSLGEPYWHEFLADPPVIGVEAFK